MSLERELLEFHKKDIYPFHMPGHKRQLDFGINPYLLDITEIDGFDDLHDPSGIIKEERERIRKIYKADESFILVNGSTSGNIAAIYASTNDNDKIIIQRNSHKSVYNGATLRRNKIEYIYPTLDDNGIYQAVTFEDVKKVVDENKDAKALILTSPSYEGYVAPIKEIADYVHKNKMLLIVDAAHGAHFGFSEEFPESPVVQGADITIMSLHKTLPAMTQTAVLHLNKREISGKVQQALDIFETSSPSYVLMCSVSKCMSIIENNAELFDTYVERLKRFYEEARSLKNLEVIEEDKNLKDISKIIISTGRSNISGYELSGLLRERGLEMEMSSFNYVIAMTSPMDTERGIKRLIDSLKDIDKCLESDNRTIIDIKIVNEKRLESFEAVQSERTLVDLNKANGLICAEAICIYPPGSPIVIPGEEISEKSIGIIKDALREGLHVTGIRENQLYIVK